MWEVICTSISDFISLLTLSVRFSSWVGPILVSLWLTEQLKPPGHSWGVHTDEFGMRKEVLSSSLAAYFLLFTQSVSLVHCSVFINQVRPFVHTHSHENCTIFAMKFKWENIGEGQKRGSTDDFRLNYPAVLLHLNFLSNGWSSGGRPAGDDELPAY